MRSIHLKDNQPISIKHNGKTLLRIMLTTDSDSEKDLLIDSFFNNPNLSIDSRRTAKQKINGAIND